MERVRTKATAPATSAKCTDAYRKALRTAHLGLSLLEVGDAQPREIQILTSMQRGNLAHGRQRRALLRSIRT